MLRKKLIFKIVKKFIKCINKKKMNLETIISATKNPNWAHDFSRKESVDFINQTNKAEMNLAFEAEKENSLFVFTIGAIYIKAECCKCFPLYLAELIYKHVFQSSQGHQIFLELLNLHFKSSKKKCGKIYMGALRQCK